MYKIRVVMIVIFMTLFVSGCTTQYSQSMTRAQSGLIDLEQYQLTDMIVPIDVEREIYWTQLH